MISTMERIGLTAHQWLYEKTDGRIGASVGGRPMLLLRHVGRKTGQPRTSTLLYVRDGDNYAVIASKGGDPKHPGWFHNLTANPDVEIQIGRKRMPVRRASPKATSERTFGREPTRSTRAVTTSTRRALTARSQWLCSKSADRTRAKACRSRHRCRPSATIPHLAGGRSHWNVPVIEEDGRRTM